MSTRTSSQLRADYGFDAPAYLVLHAVSAVLLLASSAYLLLTDRVTVGWILLIAGLLLSLMTGTYYYSTRRGKFRTWRAILEKHLVLNGDEEVLDLGCGRGAVLVEVARRLTTGRAVGIDLWSTRDQSGNAFETTDRNVSAEGVSGRVDLRTGDMTALPFPDESFDAIVSSIAIHNIGHAKRLGAIDEAVRVLRPGGRIAIVDLFHVDDYRRRLAELDMLEVTKKHLGPRFWYGNPLWSGKLLTAQKPSRPSGDRA